MQFRMYICIKICIILILKDANSTTLSNSLRIFTLFGIIQIFFGKIIAIYDIMINITYVK